MTTKKFYQTKIQVTVLSEEPIPDTMSLTEICQESIEGDYSFEWMRKQEKVLNGKQAARALLKQGSDPSFFQLTKDGKDEEFI